LNLPLQIKVNWELELNPLCFNLSIEFQISSATTQLSLLCRRFWKNKLHFLLKSYPEKKNTIDFLTGFLQFTLLPLKNLGVEYQAHVKDIT